jgi:hypothetical protein
MCPDRDIVMPSRSGVKAKSDKKTACLPNAGDEGVPTMTSAWANAGSGISNSNLPFHLRSDFVFPTQRTRPQTLNRGSSRETISTTYL